jgi:hypothetical protein
MKTVQVLRNNQHNYKPSWSPLILDGKEWNTEKNLEWVKEYLDYWYIPYLDVRLT